VIRDRYERVRFSLRRSPSAAPTGRSTSRGDGPDRPSSPADPSSVRDVSPDEKGLGHVFELVAELERAGHDARLTDRTTPDEVPPAVGHQAYLVFRDSVDLLVRRAPSPQRLGLRVRVDDGQLLVSMQSVGVDPHATPMELTAHDLGPLYRRIEAAGGRTTVRSTQNGNWIAIARLPL
jgi:signal transduction histidine kinase